MSYNFYDNAKGKNSNVSEVKHTMTEAHPMFLLLKPVRSPV